MKISVVIPCHNGAQWITEALASVRAQTLPVHEVIVVNDSSTDASEEVIAASGLADTVIRAAFRNAATSRNAGVAAATGDWIAFLDADDLWYPTHLENARDLLAGTSDVACLAHNDQLLFAADGSSRIVDRDTGPPVRVASSGLGHGVYFDWFERSAWFFPGSLVVDRARFIAAGGFDPSQVRRHDFEMFFRLIHGQSWSYHPEAGAIYRFMINPESISSNTLETSYYTLRALIKNEFLYPGPTMDRATAHWAGKALRNSIGSRDARFLGHVWRLASTRVSFPRWCLYWPLLRFPVIGRGVRNFVLHLRSFGRPLPEA
ncbi:MAG: glycosyltransferase family 2 protein [Gammaproteobacteria bacterium]|nr:glycosyltransferase family 2 protein [Gammaproteobacteria bacterium]